jgi:cell division protein FtsB
MFLYVAGVGACLSVADWHWQMGAAVYCAIRFVVEGHEGVFRRSNEELEKRITELEKNKASKAPPTS